MVAAFLIGVLGVSIVFGIACDKIAEAKGFGFRSYWFWVGFFHYALALAFTLIAPGTKDE